MQAPKISMVVPVYGVEPYLRECLDSIVAQSYRNLDIILVDDGSPDGCGKICDEYAASDDRIRVIHQENAGLSAARNVGIREAQGEYLCFVDSDDAVHPEFVSALYGACVRTGAEIALCKFSSQKNKLRTSDIADRICTAREISVELSMDATGVIGVAWNKLYAARLFEKLHFPVGRIHEDEATVYRFYWESRSCVLLEDVLYFYRIRESSITNQTFSPRRMDAALAYQERIHFYQQLGETQLTDYTKAVYCHFLRRHIRDIRNFVDQPKEWEREMHRAYREVIRSTHLTRKKKLSLSLQMLCPKGYEWSKCAYHLVKRRS